jgi:hypothetical protein
MLHRSVVKKIKKIRDLLYTHRNVIFGKYREKDHRSVLIYRELRVERLQTKIQGEESRSWVVNLS